MSNIDRCPDCGSYCYNDARHGYGENRECIWPCNHEVRAGEAACGLCGPGEDLARRAVSESESEPLRELAVALHPDSRINAMANVHSNANVH